jgi:VWFA-related protein
LALGGSALFRPSPEGFSGLFPVLQQGPKGETTVAVRIVSILILCVALAPRLSAQPKDPVFRSGVTLVEVPVLARDHSGKPIANLRQSDFRVWIDGQPRAVDLFTAPITQKMEQEASAHLPSGVYSNAPELNRDSRGLIVVVVDSLNTCVTDQMQLKRQLVQFLRSTPQRTRIALYSVGMQVRILHDFTEDPENLVRRLQRLEVPTAETVVQDPVDQQEATIRDGRIDTFRQSDRLEQQLRGWLDDRRALSDEAMYVARIENSFGALEAIVRRMAPLPGQKSLIWLSGGFQEIIGQPDLGQRLNNPNRRTENLASMPDEIFDVRARFQNLLRAATQAGVAVYPMDSRGLTPSADIGPAICDGIHAGVKLQNQQPLQEAATVTGGRLIANTNDISGSLTEVLRDIGSVYTLGVYLPVAEEGVPDRRKRQRRRDNKVAEVKALSLRIEAAVPDVSLDYRNQVYPGATLPPNPSDTLEQALRSPVDSTGLVFLGGLIPDNQPSGKQTIQLIIPVAQIVFQQEGQRFLSTVRLGVLAKAADGKALNGEFITLRATLTSEQMEQARQTGLILRHAVSLPKGTSAIRVAIREPRWGLLGSLNIPVGSAAPQR